jgi:ubiquitin-protein ligase
MAEWTELKKNPSPDFIAAPDESNLYEWHFVIRGPTETEFEGGVYHGRIVLPDQYPKKAPDVYILTPNGRFHTTGDKICLSNTSFHQESWTPLWGIQTIIKALIAFFPVVSEGIGALTYPTETRKQLAKDSHCWKCTICKNTLSKELMERKFESDNPKTEEIEIIEEKTPILDVSPLGSPQGDLNPQIPRVEQIHGPIATPNNNPVTRVYVPAMNAPKIPLETSFAFKVVNMFTLMVGLFISYVLYRRLHIAQ